MTSSDPAKPSITSFLEALRTSGGLRFEYTIRTHVADPATASPPLTEVLLSGPDTSLLLERNGELLHAIESLAAAILRLEPEQAEQLSFDAEGFKAGRISALRRLAEEAIATVKATGRPYLFAPMNSRERRLLHLALLPSGLATASSGLGPRRFVVLYPVGQTPEPERFEQPTRRPNPSRNQGGYKSGGSLRSSGPRRPPSAAAASPVTSPGSPAQDPERHGNQRDPALSPGEEKESTEARLDSIRRAFRKR